MKTIKILLPILTLICGVAVGWVLMISKPVVVTESNEQEAPEVRVMTVVGGSTRINVQSQGVVSARTEISLVSEVAGKVTQVHRAFAAGGSFAPGDPLITIDTRDYDLAITKAAAQVAAARKDLLLEEAEAQQAEREWRALGEGQATDFVLRKPHLEEGRANLAAAEAELVEAKLKRSRCDIRAPFAGRVRDKKVDVGQYVSSGETLARLYATDVAEVRLPIAKNQVEFLDLPLGYEGAGDERPGPAVSLSADFGSKTYRWSGKIVRTEGVLDEKTGMLYAVAEVNKPYAYHAERPPLAVGLFVRASIEGEPLDDVQVLPQAALRDERAVLVVDSEGRVRRHEVQVLRNDKAGVVVRGSLVAGDQVVTAGLDLAVEGMRVRIKDQPSGTDNTAESQREAPTR